MRTVIEPFRTKVVEPIHFTTRSKRRGLLEEAGYNLFAIKAEDVTIDLLTDSGTSAMSSNQWAELMRGDESYAGCSSFYRFEATIRSIFGYRHVIPVHQGRAAERILFGALVHSGHYIPSNTHFDTTRANIESRGGIATDLPVGNDSIDARAGFGGNIDIEGVRRLIERVGAKSVPFGMITLTNNSAGGQPVSLENLESYSRLLEDAGIPLFIDAARYAENAWLIRRRSVEHRDRPVSEIARSIFALADGCLMSAKKDGLSNIGGFIAVKEKHLAERLKEDLILSEGFPTYGGLTGRDLECIATGLEEALEEPYLLYRERSSAYLADHLIQAGIPIIEPAGLHAIYLDARAFLDNIEPEHLPGQALTVELYLEAGIRSCEIGTVMFGRTDERSNQEIPHKHDLVRLALPRRVYSQSHYDYIIEAIENVYRKRKSIRGYKIISQSARLRHFTCRFSPVTDRLPSRNHRFMASARHAQEKQGA
ncbi:MAG: tryptophanase [Candidatus Melainabacteria bacterium]|nr:tryptophanase [Candidatus Melainabacteria bacterium]